MFSLFRCVLSEVRIEGSFLNYEELRKEKKKRRKKGRKRTRRYDHFQVSTTGQYRSLRPAVLRAFCMRARSWNCFLDRRRTCCNKRDRESVRQRTHTQDSSVCTLSHKGISMKSYLVIILKNLTHSGSNSFKSLYEITANFAVKAQIHANAFQPSRPSSGQTLLLRYSVFVLMMACLYFGCLISHDLICHLLSASDFSTRFRVYVFVPTVSLHGRNI